MDSKKQVESAKLAYAPFKNVPAGHVYVIFRFDSGDEVAISPEAEVPEGGTFSLLRGMGKTYRLRYFTLSAQEMAQKIHDAGREVREYPLELSKDQRNQLYARMLTRALFLESTFVWYNTLFNSCITNVTKGLRESCGPTFSSLTLLVSPERFSRSA